jgi:hypothetical protein
MNDLGKDTSNSLKTLGRDVDKVGQAIKSSTKDQGKDNSQGGKDSKQSNDLEKKASNAMNFLSKESDKAEHAISSAVKGLGKNDTGAGKKGIDRPANRVTKLDQGTN